MSTSLQKVSSLLLEEGIIDTPLDTDYLLEGKYVVVPFEGNNTYLDKDLIAAGAFWRDEQYIWLVDCTK